MLRYKTTPTKIYFIAYYRNFKQNLSIWDQSKMASNSEKSYMFPQLSSITRNYEN